MTNETKATNATQAAQAPVMASPGQRMAINLRRRPFFGGVEYVDGEVGVAICGEYTPDQFEQDCSDWSLSVWDEVDEHWVFVEGFETLDAAERAINGKAPYRG